MRRPPGKEMLQRARSLRRDMTPQERLLWRHLRDRRLSGFKFRKQMWLGGFIADFACPEARLVVEADGSRHAEQAGYDDARAAALSRLGWRTLRFWNNEIDEDFEAVLTAVLAALEAAPHPAPLRSATLSPAGRGENKSLSHLGRGTAAQRQGEGLSE